MSFPGSKSSPTGRLSRSARVRCRRRPALPTDVEIAEAVRTVVGRAPERVTRLSGGANNVVARVDVEGRALVAKAYFTHPGDLRDRLGTELDTLTFLWRHGLRCVPEPVGADRTHRVAIYEFIDGEAVAPGSVGWDDALQLADLLNGMRDRRNVDGAGSLPVASEAYFTIRTYLEAMEARLHRLRAGLADAQHARDAQAFVEDEIVPRTERLRLFVVERSATLDLDLDRELPRDERTLSPADFGFHNVLRRGDGQLVFLDFEYAGWDDPAVVLAQACISPAVPLPPDARLPLLRHLLAQWDPGNDVAKRLRVVYPLVALKWSLIALNDFLPVSRARRAFAGVERERSGSGQISKSRSLLELVQEVSDGPSFLDELVKTAD